MKTEKDYIPMTLERLNDFTSIELFYPRGIDPKIVDELISVAFLTGYTRGVSDEEKGTNEILKEINPNLLTELMKTRLIYHLKSREL